MFNPKTLSKIKNEKIARWRMELSCYSFNISYPPGKENAAVDALSRVCGLTTSSSDLQSIYRELYHPGITRMTHVVRSRNLPYSVEAVKRITNSCEQYNGIIWNSYKYNWHWQTEKCHSQGNGHLSNWHWQTEKCQSQDGKVSSLRL